MHEFPKLMEAKSSIYK